MTIRTNQVYDENAAAHFATNASRVPTSLLWTCCVGGEYDFNRQGRGSRYLSSEFVSTVPTEALESLDWATRQLAAASTLGTATASRHILNVLELVIGSSATALYALTKQYALLADDDSQQRCRVLFADLGHFLEKYKSEIKLNASVCAARPVGTVRLIFRNALVSIAISLLYLLKNGYIPTGDNCPSGPLYGRVLEVCRDEPSLEDAMPHLQEFYNELMSHRATDLSATALSPKASMRRNIHPPTKEDAEKVGSCTLVHLRSEVIPPRDYHLPPSKRPKCLRPIRARAHVLLSF